MGLFNWGKAAKDAGDGVNAAFTGLGDGIGNIINSAKGQIPPEYQGQIEKLKVELDGVIKKAEIETGIKIRSIMAEAQKSLYDFSLQYEGTAEQVPKGIVIFRSLIRPVTTTLMVGSFLFFLGSDILKGELYYMNNLPPEYWWMLGIVLGFWFGGKMGENIVDKLKK